MGRLPPSKLIALLTTYYRLLVRMFIPTSALKMPPAEGWPVFTPKLLSELRKIKSEDVVHLMRFLPYISDKRTYEGRADVGFYTRCIDWSEPGRVRWIEDDDFGSDIKEYIAGREADRTAWMGDDYDEDEEEKDEDEQENEDEHEDDANQNENDNGANDNASLASDGAWSYNDEDPMDYANFLQLARGDGSCGYDVWLDTHGCSIHQDQVRASGWQSIEAVEDYYGELVRKLDALEIVVVPGLAGADIRWIEKSNKYYEAEWEKYANVYRECGWPGEEYRKEEAMEKIRALIEQEMAEGGWQ